jgi:DNA polymerase-3 subunit beta
MKVECSREHLLEHLSLVEKISGKNLSLPVLSCVLLHARGKELKLRATNLELGIETTLPAKVGEEGVVAIPAGVLYSAVSASYESTSVVLEIDQGNVKLTTGSGVSVIKAQPHDDFPTIPTVKDAQACSLPATEFLNGIRSVWYSASLSSIKPELASVYLYTGDKKLIFVATDSFRLAEKSIPVPKVPDFNSLLIPFRNISDIIRVLDHFGGTVEIRASENQIAFVYENVYLTSRLIDGSFPDYKQIIPKENVAEAIVLKQDLVNTFKKLSIFADQYNQVRMHLQPSKKSFKLSASNTDVGETIETLNAALTGGDIDIAFNHKYVTDSFQAFASDSVRMVFTGISKPMIMRGVSDNSFMYLVMPMNK